MIRWMGYGSEEESSRRIDLFDEMSVPGKKIRVGLMLTPVEFGGAERVCLTLLKHIDHQRFDVRPILLTRPWEPDNVFVRSVKEEGFAFAQVPVALNDQWDPARLFRCLRVTNQILRHTEFDVLHTNGYFADIIGISVASLRRVATMATCHGFITNTWRYRLYNSLDKAILRRASKVVAVSFSIRDELIRTGLSDDRLIVIENAIGDLLPRNAHSETTMGRYEGAGTEQGKLVVGYVGRLSPEKGVRYLLEACDELTQTGVALVVWIVGDGPERNALEDLAARMHIAGKVHFLGFQEDITKWLHRMDVFVLPSLTEGTPMALMEAMAVGVPVIGTRVGGVPKLIENEETGLLVPAGQSSSIVSALRRVIENPAMAARFAENARQLIERQYGATQWARTIEQQYVALCGLRAAG